MSNRRRSALTAVLLMALNGLSAAAFAASLDYVGTYVWTDGVPGFGGFSAIEVMGPGLEFYALSDRSKIFWGSFERDNAGRIRHVNIAGYAQLKDHDGQPLKGGYIGDSEGLAVDKKGQIAISFEGLHRIARYRSPDSPSDPLSRPPNVQKIGQNKGFESLAVMEDGTLITIPENPSVKNSRLPVYLFQNGAWRQPFSIRYDARWQPVGSDMGPDGWFYLLERGFNGLLGFSSRIRRFQISKDHISDEQILFETRSLQYDNLEGISVWKDDLGIRLTMISDDNFLFVQRTELVEYRLRESSQSD